MADRRSRQYRILQALRAERATSAEELASALHVNKRTIYRDMEDLLRHNIPISGAPGPIGGYRLKVDSPIDPRNLQDELAFRDYLDQMAKGLLWQDDEESAARADLDELAQALRDGKVYFDATDTYWRDKSSGYVPTVRRALLQSRAIAVRRVGEGVRAKRQPAEEVIMPLGLVWKAGHWYVVARSLTGSIFRERLHNLSRIDETDLSFSTPEGFQLETWWKDEMQCFGHGSTRVTFVADASAADDLRNLNPKEDSIFESLPDGRLRVTLFVDRWNWLVPLLASYGASVLVEEPVELRSAMRELFECGAALYQLGSPPTNGADRPLRQAGDSRLRSTRGRPVE
jgi:predicted DNA-binding transcriptional regulator YafY